MPICNMYATGLNFSLGVGEDPTTAAFVPVQAPAGNLLGPGAWRSALTHMVIDN
jgi:hypothetical protein